jgi:hypothetical protein
MITYIATNTISGKFYIGSTTNFERRKDEHIKSKDNYPFQNSLRKNPSLFEWEVYEDTYDEPILEKSLLDIMKLVCLKNVLVMVGCLEENLKTKMLIILSQSSNSSDYPPCDTPLDTSI